MSDWFEKVTIGEMLDRAAERFRTREALTYAGQHWSWQALQEDCDRAAQGLIHCGIQAGEHLALWLTNRPEWLHILFAAAKVGAVLVPINTRLRSMDLEYVLRQSESTTLITADRSGPIGYLDMVRQVIPELDTCPTPQSLASAAFPALRRVIVLSEQSYAGTLRWADVLSAGQTVPRAQRRARQQAVDPDATALIMYTSGTTGFPKGVMQTHRMLRVVTDQANRLAVRPTDVLLMYLPLFHCFGLYEGPLMSVITGARQVLLAQFDPGEALRLIARERATFLCGFDTHFADLMAHPECAHTDCSSLRLGILPAGTVRSEPVVRQAQRQLCPTVSGWGMTEVGVRVTLGFPTDTEDDRCLASGTALPGYEYKIVDPETGASLPPDTPGELCCRGYGVMQGYYKKPEETAQVLDGEGWLHSGDMVTMCPDGTIRFLGRYKDMLKVGGENVDPMEVEALLLQHPAISQAQVVGVPDARLHEVACACVVLVPGAQVDVSELVAFCRGKVASFKVPRHVLTVKEYPMTASGKVQKGKLRELSIQALDFPQA